MLLSLWLYSAYCRLLMPYNSYTFCFHCICFLMSAKNYPKVWGIKAKPFQGLCSVSNISTQKACKNGLNTLVLHEERKTASNVLVLHLYRKIRLIQYSLLCLNVHLFNTICKSFASSQILHTKLFIQ